MTGAIAIHFVDTRLVRSGVLLITFLEYLVSLVFDQSAVCCWSVIV